MAATELRMRRLGRGNSVVAPDSRLDVRFEGSATGLVLDVGRGCSLRRVRIAAWGRDMRVTIGANVRAADLELQLVGDGASITIGDDTTMESGCRLDATESGASIRVGRDCMLSTNVHVRTSDNHGIFLADGRRANPARDVTVGDHDWIGDGALLLKGARIGSGSIVSARAVVTHPFDTSAAIIIGSPARLARREISWSRSFDPAMEQVGPGGAMTA